MALNIHNKNMGFDDLDIWYFSQWKKEVETTIFLL